MRFEFIVFAQSLCGTYLIGLAIRDYWSLGKEDQKDDKYIVLVVDQFGGRGNILNFNVGDVSLQASSGGMNFEWSLFLTCTLTLLMS